MAYSDDAVKAKLNSLNETQDSIVANAQWIMFHRRHADRTAGLWLAKLQDSPAPKRLNLIYLANEVVQQSRARGKQDFMVAFEPMIAEATSLAYKGASTDVQGKLRRVVEVWRQRAIFDRRILDTVDQRLDDLDKQRGSKPGLGGKLGGSLFGGSGASVPVELESVAKAQASLTKSESSANSTTEAADSEYRKMNDPNTPVPTPPVHASRLSGLLKKLASAQGAVEARIEARKTLLKGLEQLLQENSQKLSADEATFQDILRRKDETEVKKKEVEDAIMQGLSNQASPDNVSRSHHEGMDPRKPEVEGFTPPPPDVEAFTPPPDTSTADDTSPLLDGATLNGKTFSDTTGAEPIQQRPPNMNSPPPASNYQTAGFDTTSSAAAAAAAAANEFLSNFRPPSAARNPAEDVSASGNIHDPRLKRRKVNRDAEDDIFGTENGSMGVDEEGISAMLNQ